jgi:hypothetical protein
MFTFLTPLFLFGAAAAAIPLVIHLSRSRRRKQMTFSTTQFFSDQFVRSYKMSRVKELLLLLARTALFGILAFALARPIVLPQGSSYLSGRRAVVLVVDNSASMGYVEQGTTLFERAITAAHELLDGLHEADSASIVLAGRRSDGPEALFTEPTTALGDVRQALDRIGVTALGADLPSAIARAEEMVRRSNAPSREIYILSDLQDSGWELVDDNSAAQSNSDVMLFFVQARPASPSNLAVTAVQYAAACPVVGIPFSIRPHIRNDGASAAAVNVSLFVDGEKVGEKRLDELQSGRWAVPRFSHVFSSGGWHSGYVSIESVAGNKNDGLAGDNRRYFAFEVSESMRVLAVNGAPSNVARLDELFFLRAALTAASEGQKPVDLTEIGTAQLGETALERFPLVILANVESIPLPMVEKLEAFVDRGGSLLVFLGDKTGATSFNQQFAVSTRLHGGLSPGQLISIEGSPGADTEAASITDVDFNHPTLVAFDDPAFASVTDVKLNAFWRLEAAADAGVLMFTSTGSPLLCEKAFGKGRVLLFASTCDRDWTSFPVRAAYLPWIHRTVAYLAQEPSPRTGFYMAGEHIPLKVSAVEGITPVLVKRPDGALANPIAGTEPNAPVVFADTSLEGVYTVMEPGKDDSRSSFVANIDPYEMDLTYLDDVLGAGTVSDTGGRNAQIETGFRELLPGRLLVHYVGGSENLAEVSLTARHGIRLWDYFLITVLLLALAEPWLANRICLRHYTNPNTAPKQGDRDTTPRLPARWTAAVPAETALEKVSANR